MPSNDFPYYQFNAADYLNDPAVLAMDADTEGCYASLLPRAWKLPEPGQIAVGLVPELARLHRVQEESRRQAILLQLSAAFDTESRPGWWIQKRMVIEYRRVSERCKGWKRGAYITNRTKAVERQAPARRTAKRALPAPPSARDVDLDLEEEESKTNTRSSGDDHALASNGHDPEAESDPDDLTWADLFATWFWPTYPRKVGKPGALRAWKAIKPQNQDTADAIGSGLATWAATWTEPRFIPHPATFLNQRRWEDSP